jgi:hypothetical protein
MGGARGPAPARPRDLLLLALQEGIDLADRRVGVLLQLGLAVVLLVGTRLALLLQLAEVVHDVATDVPDRDAPLLGDPVDDLYQLLATLLGELRNLQANHVAVVGRGEAEV